MSEVSSIDAPAWATMSTVLATVQRNRQVTMLLSEASDNQWPRTMTPMEDYKDSLSLCLSAYCIDFVILVIGLYFWAVVHCYNFLSFSRFFSVSIVQLFSDARCQMLITLMLLYQKL